MFRLVCHTYLFSLAARYSCHVDTHPRVTTGTAGSGAGKGWSSAGLPRGAPPQCTAENSQAWTLDREHGEEKGTEVRNASEHRKNVSSEESHEQDGSHSQQSSAPLKYYHRCSDTGRIESSLLLVEKSGRTRGEIAPHILRLAHDRKLNRGPQLAARRVNRI